MSIYAPSEHRFHSLLRISRGSVATPPWFATPVEADETEDSLCVTFHAPEQDGPIHVEVDDQRVTLIGRRGFTRICALPCSIVEAKIEHPTARDSLHLRMFKKSGHRPQKNPPREHLDREDL